jgi:hypothetical protein
MLSHSFSGLSMFIVQKIFLQTPLTEHRIENYGILIATCAPVIRLFLRTFVDMRREGGYPWSRSHSSNNQGNSNDENSAGQHEMKPGAFNRRDSFVRPRDPDKSLLDDTCPLTTFHDEVENGNQQIGSIGLSNANRSHNGNNTRNSNGVNVTVKTDIVVQVDEEMSIGSPVNKFAGSSSPRGNDRASTYTFKPLV